MKSERLIGKNPYDANEKINDLITSGQVEGARLTIDNLIVSSVWNPADAFAAGAWAAKTDSAFLLEDPQNLDSVAHAISYIKKKGGSVKHLTFLGDSSQFGRLDKGDAWEGCAGSACRRRACRYGCRGRAARRD